VRICWNDSVSYLNNFIETVGYNKISKYINKTPTLYLPLSDKTSQIASRISQPLGFDLEMGF